MIRRHHRFKLNSLKSKLIIAFSIVLAAFSLLIVLYYASYTNRLLINRTIENAQTNTRYILSNIDQRMALTAELSDWVYINRDIATLLIRDYTVPGNNFNYDISNVLKIINNQLASSSIGKYLTAFIVQGNNNVKISVGVETDYIDLTELYRATWFAEGAKSFILQWPGIEKNLSKMRASDYNIPIARSIIFADTRKQIGWQLFTFSPDLVGDTVKDFDTTSGDSFFVLDRQGRCLYSNYLEYQGQDMTPDPLFAAIRGQNGHQTALFQTKQHLAVYATSVYSGLQIVHLLDYRSITQQRQTAINIALLILCLTILVGILTTVFLSQRMTTPLVRLLKQIQAISGGNFTPRPDIEGEDEFGLLGQGINRMSVSINQLMRQVMDEEKKKRELEFKVLQSQINPHFIYNVINSIKVMAMIQKSEGIYQTATALGALLKETSKGNRDLITIREELDLLDKYIDIQKIRKNGLIMAEYHVGEELGEFKIPRFTLQPIVENAIIHGLEGKRGMGLIDITVRAEDADIVIEVLDQGVGMTPEKIEQILNRQANAQNTYSNVGLMNIDDRIKLLYGPQYGIRLESEPERYTKVTIRIPQMK